MASAAKSAAILFRSAVGSSIRFLTSERAAESKSAASCKVGSSNCWSCGSQPWRSAKRSFLPETYAGPEWSCFRIHPKRSKPFPFPFLGKRFQSRAGKSQTIKATAVARRKGVFYSKARRFLFLFHSVEPPSRDGGAKTMRRQDQISSSPQDKRLSPYGRPSRFDPPEYSLKNNLQKDQRKNCDEQIFPHLLPKVRFASSSRYLARAPSPEASI